MMHSVPYAENWHKSLLCRLLWHTTSTLLMINSIQLQRLLIVSLTPQKPLVYPALAALSALGCDIGNLPCTMYSGIMPAWCPHCFTWQAGVDAHFLDGVIPVISSRHSACVCGEAQIGNTVRVAVATALAQQLPHIDLATSHAHVCGARVPQMRIVRPCKPAPSYSTP